MRVFGKPEYTNHWWVTHPVARNDTIKNAELAAENNRTPQVVHNHPHSGGCVGMEHTVIQFDGTADSVVCTPAHLGGTNADLSG